ncbi:hypothetical protein NMG60_11003586 [Bertholletia excelsa]
MGKKQSWFSFLKRLFVSEPKSKGEKKSRRWRRVFRGLKMKQHPALIAPRRIITEAREEQRKQAMAVAIAMAAAAEAAIAAARAAAEVVQMTGVPQSYLEYEKRAQNLAATRIQAAYRAHLARKALRALKGLVRLQAMVRGRIVRRRVITKLKCFKATTECCKDNDKEEFHPKWGLDEKKTKFKCSSRKNWDYSFSSKEDMEALWLRKQEAILKRERMKKYSSSHRERRSDQNVETLTTNKENRSEAWNLKSSVYPIPKASEVNGSTTQMNLRNGSKQDLVEEELNSPFFALPRRSFSHVKQKSIGDETSLPNSPIFPTYMAATESAKAKARSTSTPKQRMGLIDTRTDYDSPCKLALHSCSSFNDDFTCTNGRKTMLDTCPSVKGLYRD